MSFEETKPICVICLKPILPNSSFYILETYNAGILEERIFKHRHCFKKESDLSNLAQNLNKIVTKMIPQMPGVSNDL